MNAQKESYVEALRMKTYSLTKAQQRIWYTQQKFKDSPLFNIGGTVTIDGNININAMKSAIQLLISDNDSLRIRFKSNDGTPVQYISNNYGEIGEIDFSLQKDPFKAFQKWIDEMVQLPFMLYENDLFQFTVFTICDGVTGYYVKLHHLICDGWSVQLMVDQIKQNYEMIIKNNVIIREKKKSYLDIITQEKNFIESKEYQKARNYWIDLFTPLPELSNDVKKTSDISNRSVFPLTSNQESKWLSYIRRAGVTFNTLIIALYLLFEYKTKHVNDCVVGSAFLGRTTRQERIVFVEFSNPIPVRYKIDAEMSVLSFIKTIHNRFCRSLRYQKYPYHILQNDLHLREYGLTRLYNTCINYYNTSPPCNIAGMSAENAELFNGHQDYPLQIILRQWNQRQLQLEYDYWIDLFQMDEVKNLHNRLMLIADQVMKNDQMKIKDLKLVTDEEFEYSVVTYNQTYKKIPLGTWAEQFMNAAKQYNDNIAISQSNRSVSYQELLRLTENAASFLIEAGIKKGEVVPIVTQHTIECLAVIFAIVRIGAIYLPIDEKLPAKRKNLILKHCNARFLFAGSVEFPCTVNKLDIDHALAYEPKGSINIKYSDDDPVYLIYTSGTSGEPKGILINNKNLMNYLLWAKKIYTQSQNNTFGLFTSMSFDFSITSLFLPVICGAEIRLFENIELKNIFKELLVEKKVNVLKIAPSHIALMDSFHVDTTAVHTCIVGGEQLTTEACRKLQHILGNQCRIFNEYGPAEATVGCMTYQFNNNDLYDVVPIGKPISNMTILLLDHDRHPVPPGNIGEIYIGGTGLSNGYYRNLLQTRSSYFLDEQLSNKTLYKSGDLAYRNKEGNLIYVGRINHVIKVRGRLVNLAEIKQAFYKSGLVIDAVIKNIQQNGTDQIAAYFIPNSSYRRNLLCKYLEEQLPSYIIPDIYIEMGQFPLTHNYKVNIEALPIPTLHAVQTYHTPDAHTDFLLKAVNRFLPNRTINQQDNFFAVGGDSIKAIQLSSYLLEFGIHLSVKNIMQHPVFSEMVEFMGNNSSEALEVCSGTIPCLPIVRWLFHCNERERSLYSQNVILKLHTAIEDYQWNHALPTIIYHHDALRINFDPSKNCLFYNPNHLQSEPNLIRFRICSKEWQSYYDKLINTPFELTKELLIRFYQIQFQDTDERFLMIVVHHFCIDQVSWNILLEDLDRLLQPVYTRGPVLPQKTASYQSYAINFIKQMDNPKLVVHNSPVSSAKQKYENYCLDVEMTKQLFGSANRIYNTKPQELVLSAVVMTLSQIWDKGDILYEIEGHGRDMFENLDVSRTIGWFTNLSQALFHIHTNYANWKDMIIEVKEKCRSSMPYKEHETHLKRVRYNFLGAIDNTDYNSFELRPAINNQIFSVYDSSLYLMEVVVVEINNKLNLMISRYESFGDEFLCVFKENLKKLLEHCKSSQATYTPSDFKLVDLTLDDLKELSK